ncbi:putative transcriptional regulator [Pedobacter sp. BAL39]|uniref:GntR family transcriptional regulator n=1 Tax=Pedobacter sp. BAL39 TaxID=391596 RepID=UPI00015598DC|nr:GntR family transcriptional regulator [Pedobacter sp. BAL39]EDM37285.1 putative transcriptional regulator [Pedobacter sp. BAL39]
MEFRDNKAIYLQIADYACEHILLGNWKIEEKIPSVRELAVSLEVNPNTVMRSYELLQNRNILSNKRGIGFFIAPDSIAQIKSYRKSQFVEEDLPVFFRNLYLLDIGFPELESLYGQFIKDHFTS